MTRRGEAAPRSAFINRTRNHQSSTFISLYTRDIWSASGLVCQF
jgi:hypothetical protein